MMNARQVLMGSIYETDLLLNQYLLFHYGTAEDQLPYSFGPHDSLFFPRRCVSEFLPGVGKVERSLDLGCAVGRSTFELSLWSEEVIGIDASNRFIQSAQSIRETGRIEIRRIEEGGVFTLLQRELPADIRRESCLVPPNSFALARSMEYLRIPRDVLTLCVGKSTYAH